MREDASFNTQFPVCVRCVRCMQTHDDEVLTRTHAQKKKTTTIMLNNCSNIHKDIGLNVYSLIHVFLV